MKTLGLLVIGAAAAYLAACNSGGREADQGIAGDSAPPTDGTPTGDGVPPADGGAASYKVAAVQYTEGQQASVKASCSSDPLPDVCAVEEMIKQAKAQGAAFAVTPEYGLGQQYLEDSPAVGSNPGTSGSSSDPILKRFSTLAQQQGMYITIDLITESNQKQYNTAVTFDPTGKVIDVHYKYNLYANEGSNGLSAGTEVTVFDTPLGKMGAVICSDIQSSTYESLRQKLAYTLNARVVMLPAMWGPNPGISFFKSFASKYGFYVAAANTTTPTGNGGGIFDPTGKILDQTTSTSPAFVIASIPAPGAPPPPPPPASVKLVITELMIDPNAVPDATGEWVEIYNADTKTVDLKGFTLGDASSSHTINSAVTIAPGEYKVLALSTDTATNGGVPAAYAYSDVTLNNSGDTVTLYDAQSGVVDEVQYQWGWGVTAGASLSLKQPGLDNNVAASWCSETSAWSGSAGDRGTPGAAAGCQ